MKHWLLFLIAGIASAANPQPPITPATSGTITIANTVTATVPAQYLGLSYPKDWLVASPYILAANNAKMTALFSNMGCGVLRLVSDDNLIYTAGGSGQTANQISNSDITAFAGFINSLHCWSVIYTLSYQNSANDAAEATFATAALGSHLQSFAIGNEPDNGGDGSVTPSTFAAGWNTIANAIIAAVPAATFSGPDLAQTNNVTTWDTAFASYVPGSGLSNAALLGSFIQHYYIDSAASLTLTEMLAPYGSGGTNGWNNMLSQVPPLLASFPLPFRLSEMNSAYNGGALNVSNAFGSALYAIDIALNLAQTFGASGVNFTSGGSGTNGNVPYSPIDDNCTSATIPCVTAAVTGFRPEYSGFLLMQAAGLNAGGKMVSTTTTISGVNTTAYTLEGANPNQYRTLIINKDQATNAAITLTYPGPMSTVTGILLYDASGLSDQTVGNITIQGAVPHFDTGNYVPGAPYTYALSGNSVTVYLPFGSAMLLIGNTTAEQATQSDLVADVVGVNTHMGQAVYAANPAQIALTMHSLGIRHYRDAFAQAGFQNGIGAYGIKGDYIQAGLTSGETCGQLQSWFNSVTNAEAIDTTNEPDNQSQTAWVSLLYPQMQTTWNCMQANYPSLNIYGPAFTFTGGDSGARMITGGTEYQFSNPPACTITTNGTGYSCTVTTSGTAPLLSISSIAIVQGTGATGTCSIAVAEDSNGYGIVAPPTCTVAAGVISSKIYPINIVPYMTHSNTHNYQSGFAPELHWGGQDPQGQFYANFGWNLSRVNLYAPLTPVVGTESGYVTNIVANGHVGGIPDAVGAAYFPRLMFAAVANGYVHQYVYELADEFVLTQSSCNLTCQSQDNRAAQWAYGLLRNDLSPKPSALALMNMIIMTGDPGSAFTPGSLTYTLSGTTANVNHLLVQNRTGQYTLILWIGTSCWNVNGNPPTTTFPTPQSVTVNLTGHSAAAYWAGDAGGGLTKSVVSGSPTITVSAFPSYLQIP